MKKIVLTGGGTAGHVNPNIALIPGLVERGYEVYYIGSHEGIERSLIKEVGVPYFSISTGKLRRYFDTKNFTDAFRVVKGLSDAKAVLRSIKPDIVFSKGGFVSVPVVISASRLNIPVIIHEADVTPGLANKISFKFSKKICVSFPETLEMVPSSKGVFTGIPIRSELLKGDRQKGLEFCGFKSDKPCISVMGGSTGAVAVNNAIRECLTDLVKDYNIIHLCGKGNVDESLKTLDGYAQFEYVGEELADVFAATELIVSRAGANAIFELLALNIPNILIPLEAGSRGDQVINARSFEKSGYSKVLLQNDVNPKSLMSAISEVMDNKEQYKRAMSTSPVSNPIDAVIDLIEEYSLRENKHRI